MKKLCCFWNNGEKGGSAVGNGMRAQAAYENFKKSGGTWEARRELRRLFSVHSLSASSVSAERNPSKAYPFNLEWLESGPGSLFPAWWQYLGGPPHDRCSLYAIWFVQHLTASVIVPVLQIRKLRSKVVCLNRADLEHKLSSYESKTYVHSHYIFFHIDIHCVILPYILFSHLSFHSYIYLRIYHRVPGIIQDGVNALELCTCLSR